MKAGVDIIGQKANLEIDNADKEFFSAISKHNLFGIVGDNIAFWRWKNAIKVIEKARKYANQHNVPLKQIPSKFLSEFIEGSSLEEDEQLQSIWAKLLAEEIENPDTISVRTLGILKGMTARHAKLFDKIIPLLVTRGSDIFLPNYEELHKKYNIYHHELMILEEYGLIAIQPFLSYDFNIHAGIKTPVHNEKKVIVFEGKEEQITSNIKIKIYTLTMPGRDLYKAIDKVVNNNFIYDFAMLLRKQNDTVLVNLYDIISSNADGTIIYNENSLLPNEKIPFAEVAK